MAEFKICTKCDAQIVDVFNLTNCGDCGALLKVVTEDEYTEKLRAKPWKCEPVGTNNDY